MSVQSPERGPAWLYLTECVVIAVALVGIVLGARQVSVGETVNSRLATVWSLCRNGTWHIDRPADEPPNPFEGKTIDKVMVRGRLISSKPPLLPLAMAGEYWLLERAMGWHLEDLEDLRPILQCMILSLVVLPFLLGLVAFALLLDWFLPSPWHRLFVLTALALGTQAPAFAPQLNNHVPAAGLLLLTLYFALGLAAGKLEPRPGRFILLGLFGGLVCTLDIPAGIFVLMAVLLVLRRYPKQTLRYCALGAAAPLALHFAIMIALTGSPLPVQVNHDAFLFEGSRWRNPMGIDALNEPKLTYLFHLSFGRYGTFLLFPVLTAGLAGAAWAIFRKGAACRLPILAGAAAFILLTAYYVLRTNNYGGAAYGFRWHLVSMPVLLLMGIPVWNQVRTPLRWCLAFALLGVSMYSAWECYRTPWGTNQEWTCRLLFGPSY